MTDAAGPMLPDFDNPPVVETVLSAQFEKLDALSSVHLGLFWQRMRNEFPRTQEQPALEPVFEQFDTKPQTPPRILFIPQGVPISQRLWLLNAPGTEMLQIQNDRFVKNWRKAGDEHQYPHYEPVIKPAFTRDFATFVKFLADEQLGTPEINQCEVTYVNHIVSGDGWNDWSEADKIFTFWKRSEQPYPGPASDVNFHARFPIRDSSHNLIGRLHVDVTPALRSADNAPMYVMNLTARGQLGDGVEFFDIGRRWIVNSFKNLTTDRMHKIWREKR